MGCDIHVYAEAKFNKQWCPLRIGPMYYWSGRDLRSDASDIGETGSFFTLHDLGRDYTLFGLLAGVRDAGIKPLKQPVGYPSDMSPYFKWLADDVDLHTPTFYGVRELIDAWDKVGFKRYMGQQTWEYDRSSDTPVRDPNLISTGRELLEAFPKTELRFIICFDN
jgi:hypothetical protein